MRLARHKAVLTGLLATLFAVTAASQEATFSDVGRIVAVSDIHGAYPAFVGILQQTHVLDDDLQWSGGKAHLVIVGDVLDRGAESKRALELIKSLEPEAAAAGGAVHLLLGNHEVMNLIGDLRYVSADDYAAYAADESPSMRDAAFQRYRSLRHPDQDEDEARAAFDKSFPPGYFAKHASFAPDGALGSWLLEHPFIAVIDGTAFVHGGLSQAVAGMDAERINDMLGSELRGYVDAMTKLTAAGVLDPTDSYYDQPTIVDAFEKRVASGDAEWPAGAKEAGDRLRKLFDELLFLPDSPVWYRGSVSCGPLIERDRLSGILDGLGSTRLVVGHTPTDGSTIQERFDDRVVRIDTGMLNSYFGGHASALVLEGDSESAVYAGDGIQMPVPQPRMLGTRPAAMSDDELESFLREANIADHVGSDGPMALRLQQDGIDLVAIFRPIEHKGFAPELAAYRLDRLLDLRMVPVTVMREVDGVEGSLQFVPDRAINETQRREGRLGGDAWCPLADQFNAMYVFDSLIYNTHRSADRILYNARDLRVLLIGHDLAFTTDRGRPDYLESIDLKITPAWKDKLESLDEELLTQQLANFLDRRQIRALLTRRDELLEED